ncbi:MAG: ABC transporter permease, partial [Acidobacteria bacterium]|nr:ABC transporter permease [Acidobacteriota bacterium]
MSQLLQDLRYAFRLLAKNPAFTAVAALTLAVGIGANGAIFSLTNALLLRPIAAASPDQLVRVSVMKPDGRRQARHSYLNYLDFRDTNQTLTALSAKNSATVSMTNGDAVDQLVAEVVTGNYFETLGLRPAIGRLFTMNDDRAAADRVVVIGHHFWQTRFMGDPQIIGRTLRLNGEVFTVIGVTPSEFTGDSAGVFIDAWAPLLQVPSWAGVNWQNDRNADRLQLLGRRKAGVSLAQTQADLSAIAGRLAAEYPLANQGKGVVVQQARFFDNQLRGPVSIFLAVVMALTGLVLLTACANLANLLLARAAGRRREMAIRLALGAGRVQLIRQVLCESLLLAVLGGAGGMIFGIWASDLLMNFNPLPASIPIRFDFSPDARVYGFLALLAATAGIVMGIAPALASSRVGVLGGLKDESGNLGGGVIKSRLRNLFVISQVALSLVVLVVAGLLLRSLG